MCSESNCGEQFSRKYDLNRHQDVYLDEDSTAKTAAILSGEPKLGLRATGTLVATINGASEERSARGSRSETAKQTSRRQLHQAREGVHPPRATPKAKESRLMERIDENPKHQRDLHPLSLTAQAQLPILHEYTSESEMVDGSSTHMQWPVPMVLGPVGYNAKFDSPIQNHMSYDGESAENCVVPTEDYDCAMIDAPSHRIKCANPGVADINGDTVLFHGNRPLSKVHAYDEDTGLPMPKDFSPHPLLSPGDFSLISDGPDAQPFMREADGNSEYWYHTLIDVCMGSNDGYEPSGLVKTGFEDEIMLRHIIQARDLHSPATAYLWMSSFLSSIGTQPL